MSRAVTTIEDDAIKYRKKKLKRVAFYGHFDSSNFGNECSLKAIIQRLRQMHPGVTFLCVTNGPEKTIAAHDIEAAPITRKFVTSWEPRTALGRWARRLTLGGPLELVRWFTDLRALRGVEAFILPGTGVVTDAYGLLSWGPYSLFRWSLLAKLSGAKLWFISVGVGPLYSQLGRFFTKCTFGMADYRSYRELAGKECLVGVGFERGRADPVFPDLAFSLALPPAPVVRPGGRPVVGIGVMLYAGKYSAETPDDSVQQTYLEQTARFGTWLLANGYDVRLVISDTIDEATKQSFKALLVAVPGGGEIIDEPMLSADDLLAGLAACDYVVATRFHSILLAMASNKPTLGISFHQKCDTVMAEAGMSEYCLDLHTLRAEALIEKFQALAANAESVKSQLAGRVTQFRHRLDQQYQQVFG